MLPLDGLSMERLTLRLRLFRRDLGEVGDVGSLGTIHQIVDLLYFESRRLLVMLFLVCSTRAYPRPASTSNPP